MSVAAILKSKGHTVASVAPDTTVADIATMLSQRRIGAVLVLEGEQLAGIVSERDIVRGLAQHGAATLDMNAAEIMTQHVLTATLATSVEEAMAMMTTGRFRHLPVLDHEHLVGVISIGDVVKVRLDEQAYEVDSLKSYLAGG